MISRGKHLRAVASKPFCARNAAVAGRQETFAVTARKFPLCSTSFHPTVQTAGLAVLIRSAGPVAQCLVVREREVHFPLSGRSREACPVRLVHHRDDPTSTANRLVSGDLVHFECLKRSRNVVLSVVVRGGFLGKIVEHIFSSTPLTNTSACRQSHGGWRRACSVVPKRAGKHPLRACRRVDKNIRAQRPDREPSGVSAGVQGPTARTL